jgi:hypothetical protein
MAFKAGTATAFYLANAANALQNLSGYSDNLSLPQSTDQLDVSAFGTNAKAFIPGQSGGDTISMGGAYDVLIHTQLTAMQAAQAAGTAGFGFIFGPGGSVASQARSAGSVYVAQYSVSSSVSGRVEYSASLQITGAVANGTF